jgi:hypothetical protein
MTSDKPDLGELAARVESLERQNRRLRCLAVAGLALIGGLVLIAAPQPSQAQVGQAGHSPAVADVTSYVLLKDDKGQIRGTLGAGGPGSPALRLMDETGQERATYNQEGILLRDAKGKVRAVLATTSEGAKLELVDANGKVLAHFGR